MDEARTEVPDEPAPEAGPVPCVFAVALWIPLFAVLLWFFLNIWGRPPPMGPSDEREGESPPPDAPR